MRQENWLLGEADEKLDTGAEMCIVENRPQRETNKRLQIVSYKQLNERNQRYNLMKQDYWEKKTD